MSLSNNTHVEKSYFWDIMTQSSEHVPPQQLLWVGMSAPEEMTGCM